MASGLAILVLCSLGFLGADAFTGFGDLAADVEMAITAQQISLNTINGLLKKNADDIQGLVKQLSSLKAHAHVEPTQQGRVQCVENDVFSQLDEAGFRYNEQKIEFEYKYDAPPQVHSAIEKMDLPVVAQGIKLEHRVKDITPQGFTLVCGTQGNDTQVDALEVSWLSIPSAY